MRTEPPRLGRAPRGPAEAPSPGPERWALAGGHRESSPGRPVGLTSHTPGAVSTMWHFQSRPCSDGLCQYFINVSYRNYSTGRQPTLKETAGQLAPSKKSRPEAAAPAGAERRLGSPFGVVVDENVILHSKLEVRDLLTDPPETQERSQQ